MLKRRVFFGKGNGFLADGLDEFDVAECLFADVGDAPLLNAEHAAGAADLQIFFREFEPVFCRDKRFEPLGDHAVFAWQEQAI